MVLRILQNPKQVRCHPRQVSISAESPRKCDAPGPPSWGAVKYNGVAIKYNGHTEKCSSGRLGPTQTEGRSAPLAGLSQSRRKATAVAAPARQRSCPARSNAVVPVLFLFEFGRFLVPVLELRVFRADASVRGDRLGDEDVAVDDGALADHRVAPEHRRARVDGDVIVDRRVPLHPTQRLPAARGERTQGDALVDLDVVTDDSRLPNHDAGAVVDEETLADRGAGVNVDTGLAMCAFAHHARNERHAP